MPQSLRTAITVYLALSVVALLPATASGARTGTAAGILTRHVSEVRVISQARSGRISSSPNACKDSLYRVDGPRWQSKYRWSFRAGSTPGYLSRKAAEATIRRAVLNIVRGRNDCGRPDNVAARAGYLGRTTAAPRCRRSDGRNVIGFRSLPSGVAGRACWWMIGNRIVEADVQLSTNVRWATSLVGCVDQLMLEAVMTHEAGHVFGLGHVGERRHGRLTMSTFVDGPCNNQESLLGLGDLRGLEALYP